MNSKTALTAILWAASLIATHAQLVIPSDGSDGPLNVAAGETVVIDLAKAITGPWNTNNAAHAGQGVYDPQKWAVVFKYSTVNIQGNVTFANHPSRAPVVWLVSGDVNLSGTVSLSGKPGANGVDALIPAEPGPGGFRGGIIGPLGRGDAHGPGYAGEYGNPQIVPLIGGSGGEAGVNASGGGGGGAILIASARRIALDGMIEANGGAGAFGPDGMNGRVGIAGAIRLIAGEISGAGKLRTFVGDSARIGRIRLETFVLSPTLDSVPETIAAPPANPPIIWPPESAPTVRILQVDGVDSPSEPTAPLARTADVALQNDKPVDILIESTNFPLEGAVELQAVYKFGGQARVWWRATYVSGDFSKAIWKVTRTFPGGFSFLQARATLP
ncbi:MAG: hypothetical protein J0M24_23860 [Verrucomicrobia bacterium]|nr:hypothetical protein [Verrucomicrobiota bacterium]